MPALADLAGEFVDSVIGEPCDLIGQSFGGFLSAWVTVCNPEKISSVVLQCPSGFRPPHIPQKPAGSPEEMRSRMFAHPERILSGEKTPEQLAESRGWADYSTSPSDSMRRSSRGCRRSNSRALVLQGTKDGMMPPESGQLLAREIPHAKLVYVYDAGHNIEVDQPERFVAPVRDFFSRGEAFIVNPGDEQAGVAAASR